MNATHLNTTHRLGRNDRIPGGLLILSGVIMSAGAIIGIVAPSLRDAPWTDDAQQAAAAIAGNSGAYATANALFMVATIVTCFGLVPICILFKGRSRPWALTAMIAYAFATVFEIINRTISMRVYTWAAVEALKISDPSVQIIIRFADGLDDMFYIFGFLAISLFGTAILLRPHLNKIGWLFVIGGILGIFLQVIGLAIPAMVFMGTVAVGAVIWQFGVSPEPAA